MRWLIVATVIACLSSNTYAHHPDKENYPVHPRIDVIGPLGNNLPPDYRRRYNRPSNWAGKISYYIAPSSLEAMSWHASQHRNAYKEHKPRTVMHYFFPKPWEALRTGPRFGTTNVSDVENLPSALPADQADETLQDVLQKDEDLLKQLEDPDVEGASPSDLPAIPEKVDASDQLENLIDGDNIPQPNASPKSQE